MTDARAEGAVNGLDAARITEYLARVAARDVAGARALVAAAVDDPDDGLGRLIDQLLVPAMSEVGTRWYDGRWNSAQEHVACGITESALSAASVRTRNRRPPADAPSVVVACPHGEAHVLPARFAAELLAEAGADVIVLGLPVPEKDLVDFLTATRPDGLVLSCTEPLALPGVRDAIRAAHDVPVPVLVGGAGLGPDDRRARALGADGWAARAEDAVRLLRGWRGQPPALAAAPRPDREVTALLNLPDAFVDDVLLSMTQHNTVVAGYRGSQLEQARLLLQDLVGGVACALLGQDDRLFADQVAWRRGLPAAQGLARSVVDAGLASIARALGTGFPGAQRLLDAASLP